MPGDKVNRVKSIRKWLEKAEKSYSSHKELSGELNLIMARAEMNRLDEVHDWTRKKKWIIRCAAMVMAVIVFAGSSFMYDRMQAESGSSAPTASGGQMSTTVPEAAASNPNENLISEKEVTRAAADAQPPQTEVSEPPRKRAKKVKTTVNSKTVQKQENRKKAVEQTVEKTVRPAPVMSEKEIQSVVGEAGRALRGQ